MMNFKVGLLITYLNILQLQAASLRRPPIRDPFDPDQPTNALLGIALSNSDRGLTPTSSEEVKMLLEGIEKLSTILKSSTISRLIKDAEMDLQYSASREKMADHLESIGKILDIEFRNEWFYHYPKDKVSVVQSVAEHWGKTISAFPSTKYDIVQGVDAYACDHNTAAVFHMMRVAEAGLIRLAKELGVKLKKDKPLTHGQWGEIVDAIETTSKEVLFKAPAGNGKDDAQSFYNGAASHVRALKDKYRNVVMHSRREFNVHEAADAIFHTRSFMGALSEKLSETTSKRIKWKF